LNDSRDHTTRGPADLPVHETGWAPDDLDFRTAPDFLAAVRAATDGTDLEQLLDTILTGHSAPRVWLIAHEPGRAECAVATAMGFARALAGREQAALVLDADDREQALTRWVGRREREGWIDMIRYGTSRLAAGEPLPFEGRPAHLLGVGSFAPTDVMAEEIDLLVMRLRRQADDILVVAPADKIGALWGRVANIRLLCWDRSDNPAGLIARVARDYAEREVPLDGLLAFGAAPDVAPAAGAAAEAASGEGASDTPAPTADQPLDADDLDDLLSVFDKTPDPDLGSEPAATPSGDARDDEERRDVAATPAGESGPPPAEQTPAGAAAGKPAEETPVETPAETPAASPVEPPAETPAAAAVPIGNEDTAVKETGSEPPAASGEQTKPDEPVRVGTGRADERSPGTSGVFWFVLSAAAVIVMILGLYWYRYVRVPADDEVVPVVAAREPATDQPAAGPGNGDLANADGGAETEAESGPESGAETAAGTAAESGEPVADLPADAQGGEDGGPAPDAAAGDQSTTDAPGEQAGGGPPTGAADTDRAGNGGPTSPSTGDRTGPDTAPDATEEPDAAKTEPAAPVFSLDPYRGPVGAGGWALHLYSLPDSAAAATQVAELRRRGFTTEIRESDVPGKGHWWRVYVGSFASRAEARAAAPLLKEKLRTDWAAPTRF
jgi:hypothetical protein